MGLFSFVKEAGEKLWDSVTGHGPDDQSAKLKAYLEKVGLSGVTNMDVKVEDGTVKVGGEAADQALKEKILVALGNVAGIGAVQDNIAVSQPAEAANFYTVKKGDTLSAIAKSQYGDANQYNKIFEANKPMLSHPDKIYPGQTLRIPK